MSSVRANFAANLAGQGWVTLIQLLMTPLYIRLLGIEAYGLMGFFVALQATVQIFEMGLGATVTREIARRRALDGGPAEARSLLKTVSVAYLALAALIGVVVVLAAPFLASHVIHAEKLDARAVQDAVMLMGLLIPVMWGTSLFNAALMGMERQVQVNVLRVALVTASALGAALVLWLLSADIRALLLWHLCIGLAGWAISAWMALRVLPAEAAHFRPDLLRSLWRFAAGMSAISIGGIVLMQLDKWLLINLLPLESYGYYVLAVAVANALSYMVAALFHSILPRMTLLHAQRDEAALGRMYHACTQYTAAFVLPLAAVISLFSGEILHLWTQDAAVAANAAPIASILVCGTALNGLMIVPYALQLATGNTWMALRLVLLVLVLFVPAILALTLEFGAVGAAAAWCALNAVYLVAGILLTHSRLLKGQAAAWIMWDVVPPAVASLAVVGVAYMLRPERGMAAELLHLMVTMPMALIAAGLAVPAPRVWLMQQAAKLGIVISRP